MKELKKLKKLKLSESEKRELFVRVQNSIKKLPNVGEAHFEYPMPSPFFRFTFFPHNILMKTGVLALLVLSLSGATAYASLDSLPGDLLYGVKVNVVEKVSKLASFTPESRARAETVQIERRITEFETLAEKGRLTEERTKVIEKNIEERLKNFDRNVSDIKEKTGRDKERTHEEKDLDSKLEKHAENIIKIRAERPQGVRALEAVLERVEARRDEKRKDPGERIEENEEESDNTEEDEDESEDRELEIELPAI